MNTKSTKKKLTSKPKPLTKMDKAEARAKIMVDNEQEYIKSERSRQLQQYVEYKMLKGYTEEEAERMCRQLIIDKHNYD